MSAQLIKELRERSGAGMLDCKKALDESNGNMDAAIDWLRKKGLAQAAKKSGRTAAEGVVAVTASGDKGAMIELNSETDFVARNEQFQALAEAVTGYALEVGGDFDRLKAHTCSVAKKPVADAITDAVATIGENIQLRRSTGLTAKNGVVTSYVHGAIKPGMGKIGVLLALESTGNKDALTALGKQLCMHIAASNPTYMQLSDITAEGQKREEEVSRTKAKKLFAEFVAFESSATQFKEHMTSERNFSEKQFEPKLKELSQTLPNVAGLLADYDRQSKSEDRKDKQDAEKTKKLLGVFFQEAAFLLKKMRSYGDDAAIESKLTQLYLDETMRESVLMEQTFVIDGKNTIATVLKNAEKEVGAPVSVQAFTRFALGEGIAKAEDDFAAEVAKMSGTAA
jgi:elongation factor Ts